MSMLQEFYVFLADMFVEGEGQLDPAKVKEQMEEGGFDDVTSYDVREAVNLMYEEGDVFESNQSSVLEAYTGGNHVDQSFNGSNIGVATTTGNRNFGIAVKHGNLGWRIRCTGTGSTSSSAPSSNGSGRRLRRTRRCCSADRVRQQHHKQQHHKQHDQHR